MSLGKSGKTGVETPQSPPSRRTVLKSLAAGAGVTSLAGCIANGGSDGSETVVRVGVVQPLSGPYSASGKNSKNVITMALEEAIEQEDRIDDIDFWVEDSQTDPAVARQKASSLIDEKNIDVLFAGISGATFAAISDLAERKKVVYFGLSGNLTQHRGPKCNNMAFPSSKPVSLESAGGTGYVLEEGLGDGVFQIGADYIWGNDNTRYVKDILVPQFDAEYKGDIKLPLGTTDFSSALSKAKDSGANVIVFNNFGADQITALKQAQEFGLMDGEKVLTVPGSTSDIIAATGESVYAYENLYVSMNWFHGLDNPAATEFSNKFEKKFDGVPNAYPGDYYAATRTAMRAVSEIGSTNPKEIASSVAGRKITPAIWGDESNARFRKCDRGIVMPPITAKGIAGGSDSGDVLEVVNMETDFEKFLVPCEETGCKVKE